MRGVVGAAVQGMQSHYGCNPKNIIAGIGPSIGVDHYEVGADVISQFQEKYNHDADQVLQTRNGSTYSGPVDGECHSIEKCRCGADPGFGCLHSLSFG